MPTSLWSCSSALGVTGSAVVRGVSLSAAVSVGRAPIFTSRALRFRRLYVRILTINRRSGGVNVGYFHSSTAVWGGNMSKKSARTPSVKPHSKRGRFRSPESAWLLNVHALNRDIHDGFRFVSSGINPGIEVHCWVSDGSSRTAENCIQPMRDRTARRVRYPPCRANRCDMSTYSTVRREGDKRARSGIQCVEATSVGWSFKDAQSLRVLRKTNGQRTMSLARKSNQQ